MKTKSKFFKCQCGSHALDVTTFDNESEVYICMWEQGSKDDYRLTLWEKFRWSWKILLTGRPYEDNVVLNRKSTRELGEHLIELSERSIEPPKVEVESYSGENSMVVTFKIEK